MKTIPNFLRNSYDILVNAKRHWTKFKVREGADSHSSIIPNLYSRFKTLKDYDMDKSLIDEIFADADFDPLLKDTYSFIQIQKYEPHDFIVPHKDVYSITKLHLVILTSSNCDGFICEDNKGGLIKVFDKAGTYIDLSNEFHWVDPVKDFRYSLVVGE